MPQRSYDTFILELADLLSGPQTSEEAVTRSLEIICKGFSFDRGLVYEKNSSDCYSLTEHWALDGLRTDTHFTAARLSFDPESLPFSETVCLITKSACNTAVESRLLEIFSVSALAVSLVFDEKSEICGLIVFFPTQQEDPFPADGLKSLSVIISMLVRYVSLRIYRNRLAQARTSLESILDNTGIDIYVNDFYNHDILYVNKSMAAPYGGKEQFMGRKCWQVLFPGQSGPCEFCPETKLLDEQGAPTKVYTWDYQRAFDGSWFRVFSAAFRWVDGRMAHVVSSADITDNKQQEALIQYMANYDSLTGLPNRRSLVMECRKRIDNATETEQGYLLFFDIDGFKAINDNFGHDAGDEFLVKLGEFFSSCPILKDSIYRNGGDEFVAIIGGENITKNNIRNLASFIHERFKKPWVLKNGSVYCNTSIGVACFPEDGRNAEELLHKADLAMYQAKKAGGGAICFGYELSS